MPSDYIYYKILTIPTIAKLTQCLQHRNNAYHNLREQLRIDTLTRLHQAPSQHPLVVLHLENVLRHQQDNDLMKALNLDEGRPECEQVVLDMVQHIQHPGHTLIERFNAFLEYFKFSRTMLYVEYDNTI